MAGGDRPGGPGAAGVGWTAAAGRGVARRSRAVPGRWPAGRRVLPGPLVLRQGGALHARRQLHRLVLVEGLRQGRDHHLGVAADRLSERRAGPAGVRAARLPARRGVLLVHLLADPGALPVRAGRAGRHVPGGEARLGDPVAAWADIQADPERRRPLPAGPRQGRPGPGRLGRGAGDGRRRPRARDQGVRPGPGRRVLARSRRCRWCRTPSAPGSSRSSAASMLSFYDWYADLPVASPQMFGDQTDVPESADWWDAAYLMMWGSNVPVTRTPDAHWMAEARYRGQKVVVVSPDYADNVKFADEWMPAQPGTDGALAMAMGHVDPPRVLRRTGRRRGSSTTRRRYTDLPFLVTLTRARRRVRAGQVPHRRRPGRGAEAPRTRSRRWCGTRPPARRRCPTARWASATPSPASARWNLDLGDVVAGAVLCGHRRGRRRCCCPASTPTARRGVLRRGVPTRTVAGRAGDDGVRPAARAVRRRAAGLPGELAVVL